MKRNATDTLTAAGISFLIAEDATMDPAVPQGWKVMMQDKRDVDADCLVVVSVKGRAPMIRRLVSDDGETLVLRQYNPPMDAKLKRTAVDSIKRVSLVSDPGDPPVD